MEKNFYDVLGVPETATQKEITKAYRALARSLHPDTHPDDPAAEERFKDVSHAYDVLGDADKRKEYDEFRQMVASAPRDEGFARGNWAPGPGGGFDDVVDLDDLLGGLFGGGRQARWSAPRRGADLQASLTLPFEDAVRGLTTTLNLAGDDGAARQVKVRIPAGVADGQTIRIPGKGGPAPAGGERGDLYVAIAVEPHPVFGRSGRDLTVGVPITYPQAVLGATVEVPTLDGVPVKVKVAAGTPSGRVLRVRGRGVRGRGGPGDLLVTVQVAVPTQVGDEERALLEQLAALDPASSSTGATR
jgi:molecular chaperone DnaJ